MNKRDFDSPLMAQAITYPQIARNQLEGVKRGMRDNRFPPEHILKDINNIYIRGCGDCSAAYIALEPLMKSMMGLGNRDSRSACTYVPLCGHFMKELPIKKMQNIA